MARAKFKPACIKAHCAECGLGRWAKVVGHFSKRENDGPIWWQGDYRILRCAGCENVYFQIDSVFSEDEIHYINDAGEEEYDLKHKIEHFPPIEELKREKPKWALTLFAIDEDLSSLFENIYVALNKDLGVFAAIGIRTAFDRATELVGINANLSFSRKLTELQNSGKVGEEEAEALRLLTDAGSAAAHRGWKPTTEQLDTMMSILENFLLRTFILREEAGKLKSAVPKRDMVKSKPTK